MIKNEPDTTISSDTKNFVCVGPIFIPRGRERGRENGRESKEQREKGEKVEEKRRSKKIWIMWRKRINNRERKSYKVRHWNAMKIEENTEKGGEIGSERDIDRGIEKSVLSVLTCFECVIRYLSEH